MLCQWERDTKMMFSRSQLINIHEKIMTREKSLDNRGLDNRSLTVFFCLPPYQLSPRNADKKFKDF